MSITAWVQLSYPASRLRAGFTVACPPVTSSQSRERSSIVSTAALLYELVSRGSGAKPGSTRPVRRSYRHPGQQAGSIPIWVSSSDSWLHLVDICPKLAPYDESPTLGQVMVEDQGFPRRARYPERGFCDMIERHMFQHRRDDKPLPNLSLPELASAEIRAGCSSHSTGLHALGLRLPMTSNLGQAGDGLGRRPS